MLVVGEDELVGLRAHGDITHIDIPVSNLNSAKEFYGTLFGWQINELPGFEGYPIWQAPNKTSGGGLAPREEGFTPPRSYVEVDSIDDTLAQVEASGGTVVMGGWRDASAAVGPTPRAAEPPCARAQPPGSGTASASPPHQS
ncbi:VOC family protein [Tessaracoccus massiliensis]|uniref:VOC family protein n=1 Tax=Tessaracoccus massiliensis TaxID=1522311 RepID=UPI001FE67618|nr:VOC family protein [Tessaracoccus massiliensis]